MRHTVSLLFCLLLPRLTHGTPPDVDQPLHTEATAPNDAAVVVGIEEYFKLPGVPYARVVQPRV